MSDNISRDIQKTEALISIAKSLEIIAKNVGVDAWGNVTFRGIKDK